MSVNDIVNRDLLSDTMDKLFEKDFNVTSQTTEEEDRVVATFLSEILANLIRGFHVEINQESLKLKQQYHVSTTVSRNVHFTTEFELEENVGIRDQFFKSLSDIVIQIGRKIDMATQNLLREIQGGILDFSVEVILSSMNFCKIDDKKHCIILVSSRITVVKLQSG